MGLLSKFFGGPRLRFVFGQGKSRGPAPYTKELYEQETVRAIIDCIATHTAKAQAMHVVLDDQGRVKEIRHNSPYAKLLNMAPNQFMTGYDLKYKLITGRELNTVAMAYVKWGGADGMQPELILPVPYHNFTIYPLEGGGYGVEFRDDEGEIQNLPLEDMIVLRKFYNMRDVAGDGNDAIYNTLSMVKAAGESLLEATTVSNKIRGILKQKKAMLDNDDTNAAAKKFGEQYAAAAKDGGIVGIDAMEEYTPLTVTAWSASAAQMKEITGGLLRYWRVSEPILTSNYTEGQWQAFYESVIEPALIQMGQAFTVGCFTTTERNHGNRIIFNTSTLMHTSIQTKINIMGASREVGLFTTNELREMFGYAPVENGDTREVSLNYVNADKQDFYQTGGDEPAPAGSEGGGNIE